MKAVVVLLAAIAFASVAALGQVQIPWKTQSATTNAPTISSINPITISINSETPPLPFIVWEIGTSPFDLRVSGTSTDQSVFPNTNIVFSGSGAYYAVVVRSNGKSGSATITVTVTDPAGVQASTSFPINAYACLGPPPVSVIPDQTTSIGTPTPPTLFLFSVGNCYLPFGPFTISASSSNTNLVKSQNVFILGSGQRRYLVVEPESGASGTALITITITSFSGESLSRSFDLTVGPGFGPLTIATQPDDATLVAGDLGFVAVGVRSSEPPHFQWLLDGHPLFGATNSFVVITNAQSVNAGAYSVTVTAGGETVVSRTATIRVRAPITINDLIRASDGWVKLTFSGEPGDRYAVFRSSDFHDWQFVSNLTNLLGTVECIDVGSARAQFYRCLLTQ